MRKLLDCMGGSVCNDSHSNKGSLDTKRHNSFAKFSSDITAELSLLFCLCFFSVLLYSIQWIFSLQTDSQ